MKADATLVDMCITVTTEQMNGGRASGLAGGGPSDGQTGGRTASAAFNGMIYSSLFRRRRTAIPNKMYTDIGQWYTYIFISQVKWQLENKYNTTSCANDQLKSVKETR